MTDTATLTLAEFEIQQGVRFRRSSGEVKSGLSREDAFAMRMENGNVQSSNAIPRSVWERSDLNIDNFSQIVSEETGVKGRRFRMTRVQHQAVQMGTLTKEEAFRAKQQKELSNA